MNILHKLATALMAWFIVNASWAVATPQPGAQVMPFKDIQKGMKGVGYTTFSGVEPEPFDVEIIGFNYNMMGPGQHIIIALLTGKKIEFTSTIAGMSGSPVYIDGKLIGAVSLSLSKFPKEVLVGITPFESMLKAGQSYGGALVMEQQNRQLAASGAELIPLMQVAPKVAATNNRQFLLDSRERTREFTRLIPGGPITAYMVTGDVELAGVGTITDIRDGIVYAFGHSMNGQGHAAIPFGSAEIVWVVANQQLSYKMANSGPVLGTILEDRSPAIVGKIGQFPEMIPVKLSFVRPEGEEEYNFEIIRDIQDSAEYLNAAVMSILTNQIDYNRGGTLRVTSKIKIRDHEALTFYDLISMKKNSNFLGIEITPYKIAANVGSGNFNAFWDPPKGKMAIESLEFIYNYNPEIATLEFKDIILERHRLRRGESTMAHVSFWLPDGQILTRVIPVEIPLDAPLGEAELFFAGASKAKSLQAQFSDLENYYRILRQVRPDGQLYCQLLVDGAAVALGANYHNNLPGTFAMLAGGEKRDISEKAILWEKREPLDYVISGKASVKITIY